ncbi:MAG TPA: amino acid adenylation domain-containing protein [Ktedonobacteraceae bacterium]|jgi:amino acid adenylation domain-containing protein
MAQNTPFSQRLSRLSPTKLALLEQRRSGKVLPPTAQARIERRPPQEPAWLSSTQQRLWFLNELLPGSPAYNIPLAMRLKGSLNVRALGRSLNQIIARHEILRTTFAATRGEPEQVIAPVLRVGLIVHDLSGLLAQAHPGQVERLAAAEGLRPFDLRTGPLLRARLLRLSGDEHLFLLTLHHSIADAWSLGLVFTRELAACYTTFLHDAPPLLPQLPLQYADFACWQKRWLQESEQMRAQLAYWQEQLAGARGVLELPTDLPRPAIQSFRGASQQVQIAPARAEILREFSQREGVTLFMTLLAALALLLSRYTGQTDILIGMLIANRTVPEIEPLIGFFANTLAIRIDLAGNPSGRELLKRVERATLAAYANQELPFEKVVEAMRPERDLSRGALVQVVFAHNNTPMQQMTLPGLSAEILTFPAHTSKTDLTVMMQDTQRGLGGYFEYNTDLFEAASMARLVEHFQIVLLGLACHPEQPVGLLPLLPAHEQTLLLETWNATTRADPGRDTLSLSEQFAAQVRRSPDAPALLADTQTFTYAWLAQRVALLAVRLRQEGVGTDVLVGLYLPRSPELLIAILAVFQAGGAYVPLDPAYPPARLHAILEDAALPIVLTTQALRARVPASAARVLTVEQEQAAERHAPISAPAPVGLAYVIYTSGSTGRPKGVMVEQRGMLNHLWAKIDSLQLSAAERLAQTASLNFDISVWQLLAPLLVGGQVVLVPDEQVLDPQELLARVHTRQISVLEVVPALLRTLLETLEQAGRASESVQSLRWLLATGEALPAELVERWLRLGTRIPIVNAYGPTECSDDVTQEVVSQLGPYERAWGTIPIGQALANTRLYVLDARMQPVPQGVPGELYIGGWGVGRGYLNDPYKTAQAFVPDPFGPEGGGRLYRSGDLARVREQGRLEYLGRVDQQVKVRGFRLELGEIEAVLARHPGVRACVVTARQLPPADRQLVGYLVAHEPARAPTPIELRAYLREQLPEYMLPTAWMQLESLPLTPNGKIDRQRLPDPEQVSGESAGYIPPQTELEASLVEIWEQILGVHTIGMRDNFFDLGGHSLKATQVMARVQQLLGVSVPLSQLFGDPTVAGLARAIEQLPEQARQQQPLEQSRTRGQLHLEDLLAYLEDLPEQEIQALLAQSNAEAEIDV